MKIMTFNIKNDGKYFSNYKRRLIGFIKLLKIEQPDIIGLQELTVRYKIRLEKLLKKNNLKYEIYGENRNRSNKYNDEYNSILVKDNINIINNYTYSLSDTPLTPNTRFINDSYNRIITIVELNNICLYNTHLEHKLHNNKINQLNCINNLIKKDKPIIIMGDFNLDKKYLNNFCKENNLLNTTESIDYTYFNLNNKKHIDHILISNNIKYTNIKKCNINYNNLIISDHYPISIEIII